MRNVRVLSTAFFQPFHMVFIATVKIKWQTSGDARTLCITELSSEFSFFSAFFLPFLLRFAFLAFIFSSLSSLPLFFSFSLASEKSSGFQVENTIGVRDFSHPPSALPFSSYTRIRGLTKRDFMELCRLVMGDSGFSNATRLSSTPTYRRLLPLLFSFYMILCLTYSLL